MLFDWNPASIAQKDCTLMSNHAPATGQTVRQRKSYITSQKRLAATDHRTDRLVAFVLFTVSFIGNFGMFGLDVMDLANLSYWKTSWLYIVLVIVGSLAWQIFWQRKQWANCTEKWSWRYRIALAMTVVPSWRTYLPVVVPFLGSLFPLPSSWYIQWAVYAILGLVVMFVLVINDIAQEEILVDKT
jgi:hypothetical protein